MLALALAVLFVHAHKRAQPCMRLLATPWHHTRKVALFEETSMLACACNKPINSCVEHTRATSRIMAAPSKQFDGHRVSSCVLQNLTGLTSQHYSVFDRSMSANNIYISAMSANNNSLTRKEHITFSASVPAICMHSMA